MSEQDKGTRTNTVTDGYAILVRELDPSDLPEIVAGLRSSDPAVIGFAQQQYDAIKYFASLENGEQGGVFSDLLRSLEMIEVSIIPYEVRKKVIALYSELKTLASKMTPEQLAAHCRELESDNEQIALPAHCLNFGLMANAADECEKGIADGPAAQLLLALSEISPEVDYLFDDSTPEK